MFQVQSVRMVCRTLTWQERCIKYNLFNRCCRCKRDFSLKIINASSTVQAFTFCIFYSHTGKILVKSVFFPNCSQNEYFFSTPTNYSRMLRKNIHFENNFRKMQKNPENCPRFFTANQSKHITIKSHWFCIIVIMHTGMKEKGPFIYYVTTFGWWVLGGFRKNNYTGLFLYVIVSENCHKSDSSVGG